MRAMRRAMKTGAEGLVSVKYGWASTKPLKTKKNNTASEPDQSIRSGGSWAI